MKISTHIEEWDLVAPFRIAGDEYRRVRCLVVEACDGNIVGRGEALGVDYLGETVGSLAQQVDIASKELPFNSWQTALPDLLPAGGARNALDCACWDLQCKKENRSIWDLLQLTPKPVTTAFTIGLEDSPESMAEVAKSVVQYPIIKIKLSCDRPVERVEKIRDVLKDAKLIVDANQSWTFDVLREVEPALSLLGVSLIEQPLVAGGDDELAEYDSQIPLAADESIQHSGDIAELRQKYDVINIKLDKSGGLSEALKLIERAKESNLGLMVGNMLGTSLSMAPAFVVAQFCDIVDIDGPLLCRHDRPNGLSFNDGLVEVFQPALWG